MLPRLDPQAAIPQLYRDFLDELAKSDFRGEIATRFADRMVAATDNSVYQFIPIAVVYPRNEADVVHFCRLAGQARYLELNYTPRGGGTGTNGQSLTHGLVVDVSRHLNKIGTFDLEGGWVEVEPGVVLDQLNEFLRPHGVFFAPNLSTANRATIGGMISTDASGEGSRIYGKTSQHVLKLRTVLSDGKVLESAEMGRHELEQVSQREDRIGEIFRRVDALAQTHRQALIDRLPKLQRFVTGYDLVHVDPDGTGSRFNLNAVLCGSEGTLGFLTHARLRLTRFPKVKRMVVLKYAAFDDALRAARKLVALDPGSIETIDDTIVSLAREDAIWDRVGSLLEDEPGTITRAINLVEFKCDHDSLAQLKVDEVLADFAREKGQTGAAIGYYVTKNDAQCAAMWELRKKGVGLLGNAKGSRRPIPFVEDTVVPPERLADYIQEFRAILDEHGLRYGMFGHVDVGCLHVRPALDMRDPNDEALLLKISDQVAQLAQRYGGVLWGEHGKGVRSHYGPPIYGPELYEVMREVKSVFDPHNQLNPGKLATPARSHAKLIPIDALKRGAFDRQIPAAAQSEFETAITCNGNGLCFNYHPDSIMCPSAKVTRDRLHSPKGRATVMREWLRQLGQAGVDVSRNARIGRRLSWSQKLRTLLRPMRKSGDFSHEVYDAMSGCLACKACASQCPIKVDVPAFRAEFFDAYHTRYRRPLRDHLVAGVERSGALFSQHPRFFNFWLRQKWMAGLVKHLGGIVDPPAFAEENWIEGLRTRGFHVQDADAIVADMSRDSGPALVVLPDAVTCFYDSSVVFATCELLRALGYRVHVLSFFENGKGLHIKGFLAKFSQLVNANVAMLQKLENAGLSLIALDPAIAQTYSDEYAHVAAANGSIPRVQTIQDFLAREPARLKNRFRQAHADDPPIHLFGHCTERTASPKSAKAWIEVFRAADLQIQSEELGCCGMCGVYGMEREHVDDSRGIFSQSWQPRLHHLKQAHLAVPGHSCRHQIHRFAQRKGEHPCEILRDRLLP
jgi:FAD/FMN-containing dehydrogenase/Fe-S oxidoreductase